MSNDHEWHFAISPQVAAIISAWNVPQSRVTIFDSPAHSLTARRALLKLQKSDDFDLVYTMAGPAYVEFSCPHVMGISNGYISHVDLGTFLSTRSPSRWLPDALKIVYQSYYARKADRLIFQTLTARDCFCRRLRYPIDHTAVVSNAFDSESFLNVAPPFFSNPLKVLVPAMAYPHKLLDHVPTIALACGDMPDERRVEFLLTLDPGSPEWAAIAEKASRLGIAERVRTLGTYNYADAAKVFAQSDIVLSLSVLETFSVTSLEAFATGRPHISADRPWAREISGEAALYVDAHDPNSVVRAIQALAFDEGLRQSLITSGRAMLRKYGDHSERFSNLIAVLKREVKRHPR